MLNNLRTQGGRGWEPVDPMALMRESGIGSTPLLIRQHLSVARYNRIRVKTLQSQWLNAVPDFSLISISWIVVAQGVRRPWSDSLELPPVRFLPD